MAVIFDQREAVIELDCDAPGCDACLGIRIGVDDMHREIGELIEEVAQVGLSAGWGLRGSAWCPAHYYSGPRRRRTVADGFPWVRVTAEPVKGPQGRSEPFTGGPTN